VEDPPLPVRHDPAARLRSTAMKAYVIESNRALGKFVVRV
jgi:hypothetical protein